MKALHERNFIMKCGKLIELSDSELLERQERIEKLRQQFAREREASEKQTESVIKPDYYAPGLDRLADYMRERK